VPQNSLHHPYSSVLRLRADLLRELASSIERSLVMTLGEGAGADAWAGPRIRLCEQMLARNLYQLHRAAEDVRETAFRFCRRADELDVSHRSRRAA